MDKLREILEELRLVLAGRWGLIDAVLPPLAIIVIYFAWNFETAMWAALLLAVFFGALRISRGESVLYAFGGVIGVLLAIGLVYILGRSEGFFLPNILTSGLLVLVSLVSVLANRPMVAWTSYLARRWPLTWYWHPRVRPAYSEVTLGWMVFFMLRLLFQFNFFQGGAPGLLAIFNLLTGWLGTLVLLVVSYLYGTWRLKKLKGPSVEEFKTGEAPPWKGQQRGF